MAVAVARVTVVVVASRSAGSTAATRSCGKGASCSSRRATARDGCALSLAVKEAGDPDAPRRHSTPFEPACYLLEPHEHDVAHLPLALVWVLVLVLVLVLLLVFV